MFPQFHHKNRYLFSYCEIHFYPAFSERPGPINSHRPIVKGFANLIPARADISLEKRATIGFVIPLCHEAGASLYRTKRVRRLSEPRDQRGEFRRVRPERRWVGEPVGLVARALSFGSVFFRAKENEQSFKRGTVNDWTVGFKEQKWIFCT